VDRITVHSLMVRTLAVLQFAHGIYATLLSIGALIGSGHTIFLILAAFSLGLVAFSIGVWKQNRRAIVGSCAMYAAQLFSWSSGEQLWGLRIGPFYGFRFDVGGGDLVLNVVALSGMSLYAHQLMRIRQ
jgi:hypothetical protein